DIVIKCAKTLPWFTEFHSVGSVGGSDDASEMLRRVQKNGGVGTYIGLGTNFTTSFHDKAFDFDEDVLEPSAELFVKIVEEVQSNN
ncbi:MAG: peptidase M20, partial [Cloacibacillus sp.]